MGHEWNGALGLGIARRERCERLGDSGHVVRVRPHNGRVDCEHRGTCNLVDPGHLYRDSPHRFKSSGWRVLNVSQLLSCQRVISHTGVSPDWSGRKSRWEYLLCELDHVHCIVLPDHGSSNRVHDQSRCVDWRYNQLTDVLGYSMRVKGWTEARRRT